MASDIIGPLQKLYSPFSFLSIHFIHIAEKAIHTIRLGIVAGTAQAHCAFVQMVGGE